MQFNANLFIFCFGVNDFGQFFRSLNPATVNFAAHFLAFLKEKKKEKKKLGGVKSSTLKHDKCRA